MAATYKINEVFYSLQGEGMRAGTANVFIRMTGCNMKCDLAAGPLSPGGFACDTEFASGRAVSLEELAGWVRVELLAGKTGWRFDERDGLTARMMQPMLPGDGAPWLILTGGEPGLQLDLAFCEFWHERGWKIAVETNGTREMPREAVVEVSDKELERQGRNLAWRLAAYAVDWITLSPKVAEHAIKQPVAHELKYVRGYGQGIPRPSAQALHHLVSPAFEGNQLDPRTLAWCSNLVKENPRWRLSVQAHKGWQVR